MLPVFTLSPGLPIYLSTEPNLDPFASGLGDTRTCVVCEGTGQTTQQAILRDLEARTGPTALCGLVRHRSCRVVGPLAYTVDFSSHLVSTRSSENLFHFQVRGGPRSVLRVGSGF
jgi:hypothetical protein